MPVNVIVCKDSDEIARRGAEALLRIGRSCIESNGKFNVALAGGSTPEKMYNMLASSEFSSQLDWSKTRFYFGDERMVPLDDEKQSNYAMVRRSLFVGGAIAEENILAFDTSLPTAQAAALAYEQLLTQQLGEPPVFDLALLGMGDDGHTASLFPHAGALDVAGRFVVDTPPGILPPAVDRVTVTFPVLRHARNVVLLIGGENKAEAIHDVFDNRADFHDRPVAAVLASVGDVKFILDEEAAKLLQSRREGLK